MLFSFLCISNLGHLGTWEFKSNYSYLPLGLANDFFKVIFKWYKANCSAYIAFSLHMNLHSKSES